MGSSSKNNRGYLKFDYIEWVTNPRVRGMSKELRSDYLDLICNICCEEGKGIPDDDKAIATMLNTTIDKVLILKKGLVSKEGMLNSKKIEETLVLPKGKKVVVGKAPLSKEQAEEIIKTKKNDFITTMDPFKTIYSKDILNSFYAYWTEPSKDFRKVRWEQEKHWDITRRLATWYSRNKNPKQHK